MIAQQQQLTHDLQTPALTVRQTPARLVIALTGEGEREHAQVIYVGLEQRGGVLPLVWSVMPGNLRWEHGLWAAVRGLFERLAPSLDGVDCTVIGDLVFGCLPMVRLCQEFGWHYLLRVSTQHTCARLHPGGQQHLPPSSLGRQLAQTGASFYGPVRLWRKRPIETNLSASRKAGEREALAVISDRGAGAEQLGEYRACLAAAGSFHGRAGRGWDWAQSQPPAGFELPGTAVRGGRRASSAAGAPQGALSTLEVARVAAQETQKFLKHVPFDDRCGLELFHRAIVEGDQLAWDCLYGQYSSLVLSWLHRDPRSAELFQRDAGLPDALVNAAFARFAHAVTPAKLEDFTQLAGVLKYLKLCTHCALHDELRTWRSQHKLEAEDATLEELEEISQDPRTPDPADEVMGSAFSRRLWRLLQYEFTSEEEQIVMYLSFYLCMKPAEISSRFPRRFPTPAEVSRIKRNVMERLRRDEHLQAAIRRLTAA
jgi:DNA-directed RNA polymerase specialized sigma24 family protein